MSEIRQLKWRSKAQREHTVHTSDDIENNRLNNALLLELLKHLARRGDVEYIHAIASEPELAPTSHVAAHAARSVALGYAGAIAEAARAAATVRLSELPRDYMGWVQIELAHLRIPFGAVGELAAPDMPNSLQKNHHFNKELEAAFTEFRVFMLNRTDAAATLRAAAISLKGPVANMVSASISLAEYWVSKSSAQTRSPEFLTLQRLCDRLAGPAPSSNSEDADYYEEHFYTGSVHLLFQHIWDCARDLLTHDAHLTLARYWLRSDAGHRCKRFPNATRGLAISLTRIVSSEAVAIRRELLSHVEASARLEEETTTLAALSAVWNDILPSDNFQAQHGTNVVRETVLGRAIEWQEAFDQERRLHEPKSSGSFLEVDTTILTQLAARHSLAVFAKAKIQRTTDRFKPEFQMIWQKRSSVVRVC